MKADIYNAFLQIKADQALIAKTENYIAKVKYKRRNMKNGSKPKGMLTALSACLAMLCLAIGMLSWRLYTTSETIISVDVNPSIEFALNRFDRVVSVYAYNAEGEALLRDMDIGGKSPDIALEMLISEMGRVGYIKQDGLFSITVQTANVQREQSLCKSLITAAEKMLQGFEAKPSVEVYPVTVDIQIHAHDHNMTPAKYLAILELMEVDEAASLNEYCEKSIGQIRQRTQQCRQEHSSDTGNGRNNSGNRNDNETHGHGHH